MRMSEETRITAEDILRLKEEKSRDLRMRKMMRRWECEREQYELERREKMQKMLSYGQHELVEWLLELEDKINKLEKKDF